MKLKIKFFVSLRKKGWDGSLRNVDGVDIPFERGI